MQQTQLGLVTVASVILS